MAHNKKINALCGELRKYPKETYRPYFEKISHQIALSFDILNMIGEKYPELNYSQNLKKQTEDDSDNNS